MRRNENKKDKELAAINKHHIIVAYGRAVLRAPKGDISVFYYKSKINSYNFSISALNLNNDNVFKHKGEGWMFNRVVIMCI